MYNIYNMDMYNICYILVVYEYSCNTHKFDFDKYINIIICVFCIHML